MSFFGIQLPSIQLLNPLHIANIFAPTQQPIDAPTQQPIVVDEKTTEKKPPSHQKPDNGDRRSEDLKRRALGLRNTAVFKVNVQRKDASTGSSAGSSTGSSTASKASTNSIKSTRDPYYNEKQKLRTRLEAKLTVYREEVQKLKQEVNKLLSSESKFSSQNKEEMANQILGKIRSTNIGKFKNITGLDERYRPDEKAFIKGNRVYQSTFSELVREVSEKLNIEMASKKTPKAKVKHILRNFNEITDVLSGLNNEIFKYTTEGKNAARTLDAQRRKHEGRIYGG
jgi:hypothetical protein